MNKPYGVKAVDNGFAEVYVTGPSGEVFADAGIEKVFFASDEADAYTAACEENAHRIAACLNACEGLDTDFLADNKFLDCSTTHRMASQRDALLVALKSVYDQYTHGQSVDLAELREAIFAASTTGPTIAQLQCADHLPKTDHYTSVSKGGSYTKLGAIRGAGALKGLAGIAYQNDKGDLFIREPECFAKRMVLVEQGGAS